MEQSIRPETWIAIGALAIALTSAVWNMFFAARKAQQTDDERRLTRCEEELRECLRRDVVTNKLISEQSEKIIRYLERINYLERELKHLKKIAP